MRGVSEITGVQQLNIITDECPLFPLQIKPCERQSGATKQRSNPLSLVKVLNCGPRD